MKISSVCYIDYSLTNIAIFIKSPQSGVTMFSVPPRPPPPRPPPQLLPLTSKPFELNLRYLAQIIHGSGEMYSMTFPWPWPKQYYCLSHGYYVVRFWKSSVGNFYFGKFSLKNSDVYFQGQTLFWPYLRNAWSDWCEPKRKCICWILGTICDLTFELTHDLDLGCFTVKFRNSSISGIVGLIDVKWKRSELIRYWADCMTLPFDHTHDLDPGVEISKSKSEIAISQEWEGRLTWNEKDGSHQFMTMI